MHLTVLSLEQKFPQIAQKISKNKNKFSELNFLVIVNNFCSVKNGSLLPQEKEL